MKRIIVIITAAIACSTGCHAQTYLETLQKEVPGQGTVTVTESKEIDDLVNGKTSEPEEAVAVAPKVEEKKEAAPKISTLKESDTAKSAPEKKVAEAETKPEESDITEIDTSRKIMRGSYKITGYRVQAFSGGNSRAAKNQAGEIGDAIKHKFPNEPVYVHFYSPRWTCRVGNYRTYEEAHQMLKEIKAMGYSGACIVKGKITVQ